MRGLAATLALGVACLPALQALPQDVGTRIVRDGSIGPDASVQPVPAPRAQGGAAYEIGEDLGARTGDGATLFHSFQTFDVGARDVVVFGTDVPTRTVIARVTGGVRSNIFGTVSASGPPLASGPTELFFLNPAGILLGPTGRLSGERSFVGSTADRLRFADGSTFETRIDASPPLLAVGAVTELSFGSAGSIRAEGSGFSGNVVALVAGRAGTRVGLERSTDPTLPGLSGFSLLQAGDPAAEAGSLLLSRTQALNLPGPAGVFLFADGSIDFLESSVISPFIGLNIPSSGGARLVALATGPVRIRNALVGDAPNFGEDVVDVRGATIDVERSEFFADRRFRLDASGPLRISNSWLQSQRGGLIGLRSGVSLRLDRTMVQSDPRRAVGLLADISTSLAGRIELTAPLVEIANQSRLSVNNSLNLTIGGEIRIAGDRVRVSGGSELSSQTRPSPLPREGTPDRTIFDLLGNSTEGSRAGSISILAGEIEIVERSRLDSSALGDLFISRLLPDRFENFARGAAGEIRLDATRSVRIADSQLDTRIDARFSGPSGSIRVRAPDVQIERSTISSEALSGEAGNIGIESAAALVLRDSSLTSSGSGTGNAGSVFVSGGSLSLESATILSSNTGSGRAGSVSVDATQLRLSEASRIASEARRGPAPGQPADGSVAIGVREGLEVEGGSSISASVDEGQGGDVRIVSRSVLLRDGAQVLATTRDGNGGRIEIATSAFLADPSSRVSANAGVGTSGTVEIRSPDVDLQGGIEALSTEFLNVSSLLRPSCEAREVSGATASFYVSRAPGLPASPEDWQLAFDAAPREVAAGESAAALLAAARSQQSSGAYAQSLATLERALAEAERAGDRSGIAAVLAASGNAQQALGERAKAEALLTRGARIAEAQGESALTSRIENDLGNHYAASGANAQARRSYADAIARAERSGDALATVKALGNAARLALEAENGGEARVLLERADERLSRLQEDPAKVALSIHLGRSRARLAELATTGLRTASLLRAHALFTSAGELARTLGEPRLRSYALGNLGGLYQGEHRFDEALALTREALRAAERAQASDALYRWHWQEGQLLWAQGKADPAVRAYRRAVDVLEATQQESRARYGAQASSFGRSFAPVYLDLADALLRSADSVQDPARVELLLLEARSTVEKLKAAELRNYLRDDCATQLEARTASLDSLASGAAVVYPIALRDRLELLVRLPSGLARYTVPVGADRIEAKARELRLLLQDRTSAAYRPLARQLYDWLVRPYAASLDAKGVETLVFVPAGALRAVPMAALHDGRRFLVERFAVAAAPGLALVDPRPLDLARVRPLLGGVSEAVQEFPALGSVPRELATIREMFGGEVLLDADFQTESVEEALRESRPTLVHLASHAVFTGDPETSFVLTHDGRMTMRELAAVLGSTRFRSDPVELLVLSACDTAVGDDRAALGLAGIAVRSGARSALGSLWAISDEATYPLIQGFYAQLREPGTSRAAALRKAQRQLLASEKFSHPFYWSTFVLISNWL